MSRSTRCKACAGARRQCASCKATRQAAYRSSPRGRAKQLLSGATRRSNKRGHPPVQLTVEDILERLEISGCDITGEAFYLGTGERGLQHPFAPSLHRRDSSKHYTRENTQVVLWCVNNAISRHDLSDFLWLAEAVLAREGYTVTKPKPKRKSRRRANDRCPSAHDMFPLDALAPEAA